MSSHSQPSAGRRARLAAAVVATVAIVPAMTACSAFTHSSSSAAAPAGSSVTAPASTTGATASPAAGATSGASTAPSIVAATTSGAIVRIDAATGAVLQTLVPAGNGVEKDEISVSSSNGMVYYAAGSGACDKTIYSVPDGGGTPAPIVAGTLPAISPDGTKLAYAVQPGTAVDCTGSGSAYPGTAFKVDIRTLSTGATVSIPEVPPTQAALPAWITHLSWAQDSDHLAVSVMGVQDNEGWALNLLDTSNAQTYTGANITTVPVTGASPDGQSYFSEGVYQPDGDLFVVHNCCAGVPAKTDAPLLWEIQPNGALIHQVAIGFLNMTHDSLDVSADGNWLLYLGGGDLYVSQGGARPSQIATGLVAAAWT